jgi:hypothetical protein
MEYIGVPKFLQFEYAGIPGEGRLDPLQRRTQKDNRLWSRPQASNKLHKLVVDYSVKDFYLLRLAQRGEEKS